MAALVEASHPSVPPDDVRPVILHIVRYFVTEANSPEIIEVGLNTIREVCARSINILTEDELADLCSFRKHKNKGVSMAVKSLINTYRELHPQLLHRSLRGREATMAVSRGEVQTPQFGELQASEQIEGLDLLAASKKHKVEDGTAADAKDLMTEKVLSPDDFKQLRKLRLQKSIELQMGRKRPAEEMSSSSNSGSDSDADAEEDERGLTGRLPDQVSGEMLAAAPKRARTKAERLARVRAGRTDFKEKIVERAKNRKGGRTNKENARNKPLLMTLQSRAVKEKRARTAKQKLATLRGHIKTLRKNAAHPKRRR